MCKRAVAYCRVSTPGQTGEGKYGIAEQRSAIEEYCKENGIEIVEWYIDEGVSGKTKASERPAMMRLLSGEVTNPPTQYVVVAKSDRISRDVQRYYATKELFSDMNLELVSVSDGWSSAQDKMMAVILEGFMAIMAEMERETINLRMSGGRKQKAKQGGYAGGGVPYGYKVINGNLEIEEAEAEVVRKIFKWRNEKVTLRDIIATLKKEGYKTRSGGDFALSTLHGIIDKENLYKGLYKYGNDGWVKGRQDAILTE